MSWESEKAKEPRDWTRMLWIGIALLLVLMVGALMMTEDDDAHITTANIFWIEINFPVGVTEVKIQARTRARALCEEIHKRILNGEKFEDLAREFSTDEGTRSKGGYLGLVHLGEMQDQLDDYIWTCPLNKVSDIIATGGAFYLLKVVDRNISEADQYEINLHRTVFEGTAGTEPAPVQ